MVRLSRNTDSLERAFDAAKYGGFADEPSIELAIPSIGDPDLAPAGRHVLSAYVQFAPFTLRGTTWDLERDRLGDAATRTIASFAPGFEKLVVARHVITPLDLERTYGLTGGHPFHGGARVNQLLSARRCSAGRGTARQSATSICAEWAPSGHRPRWPLRRTRSERDSQVSWLTRKSTTRSKGSKPNVAATDGRRFELALIS